MSVLDALGRMSDRQRAVLQLAADCVAWLVAIVLAIVLRYDLAVPWHHLSLAVVVCTCIAIAVHAAVGRATLLYRGRYRFGSFEEVAGVTSTAFATGLAVVIVDVLAFRGTKHGRLPLSVPIAAGAAALLMMVATRYAWRGYIERRTLISAHGRPLIVFGAGEGGWQIVRSMLMNPKSPYTPVALLDDDPLKQNLRMYGVGVHGGRERLERVAEETGARELLVAIPSAGAGLLRDLTSLADGCGLRVKVLPRVADLFERVDVSDIRDLDLEDLLGRRQVDTDLAAIAHYLTDRRVMVTGAGGSIGSELCRQIMRYEPAELVMLDRDESALHAVELSLHGRALLDSPELVLADIRDREALFEICAARRPDVVFHSAALKHLTLLERYPAEAVKTNVQGTLNVLDAALAAGVSHFVNISTDKAVDPICVLGYSKRVTERLTAGVAASAATGRYLSVRFGNVLGSRGSVLTTFAAQVAAGGPITVTHPDVTRYFMTIPEAVELVIQAGAIGESAQTLVLDMGTPVRINDVARRLAAEAPRKVEVVYTGLRPGEKLEEDLFAVSEEVNATSHPMISSVEVDALNAGDLAVVSDLTRDPRSTLECLALEPNRFSREVAALDPADR